MIQKSFNLTVVLLLLCGISGCYNDILDPTQLGRFEPTPTVNVILDTLGVADEPSPTYEGAEEPRPADLIPAEQDYVLGPGDVVRISIFELYQIGQAYVNQYIVTETGRLSIPDVGIVAAEGLTEAQLEQEIADILSPDIIKDPSITVTLLQSQSRYFSIVGQGVGQNGRFELPRYPLRLTEAISYTGGLGDFNVSYAYVSRDVSSRETFYQEGVDVFDAGTSEPDTRSLEEEMLEIITPSDRRQQGLLITSAEMATRQELEALATPEGIEISNDQVSQPPQADRLEDLLPDEQTPQRIEWVFEDGRWKPIEIGGQSTDPYASQGGILEPLEPESQQLPNEIPSDFGLADVGTTETATRVIKIPLDRLLAGDPRYNIVIRPGDRITVPRDVVGEFWVGGNVNGPGAYPITGRPITLKQAIVTAGGLNQIAQPKKVEVIRRLGKNQSGLTQEEIVLVDLKKIAEGLQPDFFIKPFDTINVGTSGTSRWLAQLRNAFRATYGFGFIYDRNFAATDFDGDPFPGHFGFNSIF